jgi:hypothetical protein
MTDLPGYDDWKTHDPNDDRCRFCGAHPHERLGGWQPTRCTGKCRINWRDPDFEYDQMRDEKDGK